MLNSPIKLRATGERAHGEAKILRAQASELLRKADEEERKSIINLARAEAIESAILIECDGPSMVVSATTRVDGEEIGMSARTTSLDVFIAELRATYPNARSFTLTIKIDSDQ